VGQRWLWHLSIFGGLALVGCAAGPFPAELAAARGAEPPVPKASQVVAVLPFRGHPAVRRSAGEWFAHKLHTGTRLKVISPGFAEASLFSRHAFDQREPGLDEIQELGQRLGAQMVVTGSVRFPGRGQTPEIDLQLIDVSLKEVLARVSTPAEVGLFVHDPYELTLLAVEQAAKKMLASLETPTSKAR